MLLILLATAAAVLRAIAFYRYRFDSDEPQHLHVTWGWSAGLLQYRDFFDNHAPLFHMLTAPILSLVGERPDVLLYMRGPMLILFAIVVWSTYVLGTRLYSKRVGVWSALMLALFPIYFLKSIEFRTDNLWTAFWCLALLVLTGGKVTPVRIFLAGLLLGCAMATSLKTLLLLLTLGVAAVVTYKFHGRAIVHALREVAIALAGAAVVPAIIAAYFYAKGALSNLVYCAITFNELASTDKTQAQLWLQRIAYLPALAVILWIAKMKQPASEDRRARWRFFLAFSTAFFGATLAGFWVLISPRDMLPMFPILIIFLVAAIDRLDIRLPLYAGTCFLFAVGIWYYADHLEMRTDEHITMMNQVLGLTRPGEPIIDLKGETIYRRRAYYYIFEFITRRAMLRGMVPDTIAEDVIRTQCHVAQADGPFFPPAGAAFLRSNFLDVGRLRASGQWINDDGSFTIGVPGQYVILNSTGEAEGALDGLPYRGKRMLGSGAHSFVTANNRQQLAVFWAPAFERGYSPFHLRDREFTNSPVYRSSRNHPGAPPGRRRHRRWRSDPAPAGSSE
jgi:dolichyl-phosphate-mannose-protein mannosyltransferase